VIAVSCGIKISAVHDLVLSQYMHLTDERTNRQTDGQKCNSNTMRCITWSRMVIKKAKSNTNPNTTYTGITTIFCCWK